VREGLSHSCEGVDRLPASDGLVTIGCSQRNWEEKGGRLEAGARKFPRSRACKERSRFTKVACMCA
jgi:hypothetical protein